MSSSLMSCVRENSPPLHLDTPNVIVCGHNNSTATATSATVPQHIDGITEQQKRRRFHPLRNLRRMFRRRTITSVIDTPISIVPCSFTKDEPSGPNLRCATYSIASPVDLTSLRSTASASATATSSKSLEEPSPPQYSSQSLPKYKPYTSNNINSFNNNSSNTSNRTTRGGGKSLLECKQSELKTQLNTEREFEMNRAAAPVNALYHNHNTHHIHTRNPIHTHTHSNSHQQQQHNSQHQLQMQQMSLDGTSLYMERSKASLCINEAKSALSNNLRSGGNTIECHDNAIGGEMAKSELSIRKTQLVDSCLQSSLSQSHDSVFSETVTSTPSASFSIGLKKELSDVLSKRRNVRLSPSEESELGIKLTMSQDNTESNQASRSRGGGRANQKKEMSLSMRDIDDNPTAELTVRAQTLACVKELATTSKSIAVSTRKTDSNATRTISDEMNAVGTSERLSHAAARHRMAIRPPKKKVPSRMQHKSEKLLEPKQSGSEEKASPSDKSKIIDTKIRVLTPEKKDSKQLQQRWKKEGSIHLSTTYMNETEESFEMRTSRHVKSKVKETKEVTSVIAKSGDSDINIYESEPMEACVLDRTDKPNSKRSLSILSSVTDSDIFISEPKKLQISTSCFDTQRQRSAHIHPSTRVRSSTDFEQNIKETRKEIQREILYEGQAGLSAMLNTMELEMEPSNRDDERKTQSRGKIHLETLDEEVNTKRLKMKSTTSTSVTNLKPNKLDTDKKDSVWSETTTSKAKTVQVTDSHAQREYHYERKPKIVGLSPFQQRITQTINDTNQPKSLMNLPLREETSLTSVEKSQSFRIHTYHKEENSILTPSLPDLSMDAKGFQSLESPHKRNALNLKINSPKEESVSLEMEHTHHQKSAFGKAKTQFPSNNPPVAKVSPTIVSISSAKDMSSSGGNIIEVLPVKNVEPSKHTVTVTHKIEQIVPQTGETIQFYNRVASKPRPKSLNLKAFETSTLKISPEINSASLRVKQISTSNQDLMEDNKMQKKNDRKSDPPLNTTSKSAVPSPVHRNSQCDMKSDVPEFMKIQLNRVGQTRLVKSTCPSAKESPLGSVRKSSSSIDIKMRRLSNDSVEIEENVDTDDGHQAFNVSMLDRVGSKVSESNSMKELAEQDPPTNKNPVLPISPKTDSNKNILIQSSKSGQSVTPVMKSLEERKRIFIGQEATSIHRKSEDIRYVRKKSITADVLQKSNVKMDKIDRTEKSDKSVVSPSASSPVESGTEEVVLRKKSLTITSQEGSSSRKSSVNNDMTPELMKVFARRSMKVKDESSETLRSTLTASITPATAMESQTKSNRANNEPSQHKTNTASNGNASPTTESTKQSQNADSDKENQFKKEKNFTKRHEGFSHDQVITQKTDEGQSIAISSQPKEKTSAESPTSMSTNSSNATSRPNSVVLRKKSFGITQHTNLLNTSSSIKEDSTPELMKVFARRSMKISEDSIDK